MAVRREQLALALGLLCFAGVFHGSLAIFRGAPYVPDVFTNANGQGGFFFCISVGQAKGVALPAGGAQAKIQTCDATPGSPTLLTWVGTTIQPIASTWAGHCLDSVEIKKGKTTINVAWWNTCSGAATQNWYSDEIGRLWNYANGKVLDDATISAKKQFVTDGDLLIVTMARAGAATQSWFYISGSTSGYTGKIVSHLTNSNNDYLCLDHLGGTQSNTKNMQFTLCGSSNTQNFKTTGASVTKSCNALGVCTFRVTQPAPGTKQFPSGEFRIHPLDASGNIIVDATTGNQQCVGFACNGRECVVQIANGSLQFDQGDTNYQILVRDCSPWFNANKIATRIPAPGPRDVLSYQNHGNVLAFFGTKIEGNTGNNTICLANSLKSGVNSAIQSSCSFRTIVNNIFFTLPSA